MTGNPRFAFLFLMSVLLFPTVTLGVVTLFKALSDQSHSGSVAVAATPAVPPVVRPVDPPEPTGPPVATQTPIAQPVDHPTDIPEPSLSLVVPAETPVIPVIHPVDPPEQPEPTLPPATSQTPIVQPLVPPTVISELPPSQVAPAEPPVLPVADPPEPPVIRPAPIAPHENLEDVPQGFIDERLIRRVFPAVVRVSTDTTSGTGCIVGQSPRYQYVLTCAHCCADENTQVDVAYYPQWDRSVTTTASVVAREPVADLALLQVAVTGITAGLPIPTFSKLPNATQLLIVGHPDGERGAFVAAPATGWGTRTQLWGVQKTSFGGQSGSPVLAAGMLVGIWHGSRPVLGERREGVCTGLWSIERFLEDSGYRNLVRGPRDTSPGKRSSAHRHHSEHREDVAGGIAQLIRRTLVVRGRLWFSGSPSQTSFDAIKLESCAQQMQVSRSGHTLTSNLLCIRPRQLCAECAPAQQ